jgi:hypothetical protein
MATDGVKIIDGDTAHDTYWGIMDLYDSGVTIEDIKKETPFPQNDYFDDFEYEIYATSYALAIWEIGGMTDSILQELRKIIDKGIGVETWTEEINLKAGKQRQKELEKLWKKISEPNLKIRARKKYRKITNFHFQPDDLLTFQIKDGSYCAVICAYIYQYRRECSYKLIPTTYNSKVKPTVEAMYDYDISAITIGSVYSRQESIERYPNIEFLWDLYPYLNEFELGLVEIGVLHEDFFKFKQKFEKVGILKIKDSFKEGGAFSCYSSFEYFDDTFSNYEKKQKGAGYKKFPIFVLCE